jgi:hypothetical protein
MQEALQPLGDAKYFTTLDLASGFLDVQKEDKPKTAITTRSGVYAMNFMPQGMKNSPAFMQELLEISHRLY